jgi:hypothetical protein
MQNQASTSSQVQQDQQVASSSSPTHDQHQHPSNQVQMLQPTNIARDHPLDSIIGDIQRGVVTPGPIWNLARSGLYECYEIL